MRDLPELKMRMNILGKISSSFVERHKVVYLLIFSIFIMGVGTYISLPKEIVPDISANMIYIYKPYPGASVLDVDAMVSDPIEKKMESVDGVTEVSATIGNGYTQILLQFEDNVDMKTAEQEVRNEISRISFPEGVMDGVVGVFETVDIPTFKLTVTGDYDLIELNRFGDELKSQMENVKGIREVELTGGYEREIRIIIDPVRLMEYGLTSQAISNALQSSNINIPAGEKNLNSSMINVRVDERFKSIDDIRKLVINASPDRTIFLRDVAVVADSHKIPDQYSRVFLNEEGAKRESTPVVYITVYREKGADIVKSAEALRTIASTNADGKIPEDVNLIITSDMSVQVEEDLSTVIGNAIGGLLSVIIVLYIFIGLNEALIVGTVIPLSLFISFLLMKMTNITFNTVSLAGFIIALGLLVDNAIVVMENIDRLRDEGLDRKTASKIGTNQVAPAILAATLTTVGAFLPVALASGMMGKFLGIMPKTIIYILIASFFVSIVITPTLSSKFLTPYKKKIKEHKLPENIRHLISAIFIFVLSLVAFANQGKLTLAAVYLAFAFTSIYAIKQYAGRNKTGNGLIDRYKEFVKTVLVSRLKKGLILLTATILFVLSLLTVFSGILKLELFPYEEPSAIAVLIEGPVGTPLDDMDISIREIEMEFYNLDYIDSFTTTVGDGSSHNAKIVLEIKDKNERTISGKEIEQHLREILKTIPGIKYQIQQETSMARMSGGAAVSLGLLGDDVELLEEYAAYYLEELKKIEGVLEPRLSTDGGKKELLVDIDENRATYYGLSVSQIASDIRRIMSGAKVGVYVDGREEYDIAVYYSEDLINSTKDFDKIFFINALGEKIHFHDVASFSISEGIGTLKKENGKKAIYVEADLAPSLNGSQVNKNFALSVEDIELPNGIRQTVGGEMKELNDQISNMLTNFGIAILLVYIILVLQFNSFIQPVIILASIPFAIIGVVFGLLITGNNLGFYAMFGIVSLVGIAVNDAIVLIDYINYLRNEGIALLDAISEAVKTRFQPVIATSLTTIGGVLPLALYNSTFSQLGYALIFGLLASTVLTLLIIPIIYYSIEKRTEKWRKDEKHET